MLDNKFQSNVNPGVFVICPYLGTPSDPKTSLAFPSASNCCHHCKPVAPVAFDHQKKYCLPGDYKTCPVIMQATDQVLPHNLQYVKRERFINKNVFLKTAFSIPALLAMVFIFGGSSFVLGVPFPTLLFLETSSPSTLSVSPTLLPATPALLPEPVLEVGSLGTPTPSPLAVPISTLSRSRVTPIVTRKPHDMEEWIGVNYIFLIYRVKQAWTIERLAAQYDTTAVTIAAVNYKLSTPLYPGQLVIIPINQVDVSGLPQFEPYQVEDSITLEKLAVQLNTDPYQLRYFNGFGVNEQLMAKEWIIVPRERTK